MKPLQIFILAIGLLMGASGTASAAVTVISDVGDRDGYNGAYDPDTQMLPYAFVPSTMGANDVGEAAFTDRTSPGDIFFHEPSPTGVMYNHSYLLPSTTILSVTFEIVTLDNAGQLHYPPDRNGRIFIDGVEIRRGANQDFFYDADGDPASGGAFGVAEFFSAVLPASLFPSLADGSATVEYRGSGSNSDGVAVDYNRLTFTVVPEPSRALLLGVGIILASAGRRRPRS